MVMLAATGGPSSCPFLAVPYRDVTAVAAHAAAIPGPRSLCNRGCIIHVGCPSWSASSARRMDRTRASRRLASRGGTTGMAHLVLKRIASILVVAPAALGAVAAVP